MNKPLKSLAFDFGASSGRAILGIYDGRKITIEEIHRFSNDPVSIRGSLHWDILRLFFEIKQGILKCANSGHRDIASMAVDTWGVDFGLLDGKGNLVGNPYHYRDARTDGMTEEVYKCIPKDELYTKTGIQIMKINTLFQLYSMKIQNYGVMKEAKTMLMTPDLFNYFLTGIKAAEYSIASTSQILDPYSKTWSKEILQKLALPESLFAEIVPSGTVIGSLSREIASELGVPAIPVVASASHDTQSAIASVPAATKDYVYISCGTWSLMGVETDRPIINEMSNRMAFTNEGGVEGKITFLKNIIGLWLVQECKQQWDREGENVSFAELEAMADRAKPFMSFIDPDHEDFMAPGDLPARIREYCKKTNQPVPENKGEIVRCIAQSLALKYRLTVDSLESILGKRLPVIHMVGGGIKDKMLCRFTANATAREVIAGPVEATSVGNIMVQMLGKGEVSGLSEIREIVGNSFPTIVYEPQDTGLWADAYERFKRLLDL